MFVVSKPLPQHQQLRKRSIQSVTTDSLTTARGQGIDGSTSSSQLDLETSSAHFMDELR
jgi:hypothetical protein